MPDSYSAPNPISYEQIDVAIRPLIALVNELPGIKTISSCAGHQKGEECRVVLTATTMENLARLISLLPTLGAHWWLDAGVPVLSAVWITVEGRSNGREVQFCLHLTGRPDWARRDLIDQIERALSAHLAGRGDQNSVTLPATTHQKKRESDPVPARKSGDPRPIISDLAGKYPTPGYDSAAITAPIAVSSPACESSCFASLSAM